MSEERDNEQVAGAAVEQAEVTDTQVLAAVERAAEVPVADPATQDPSVSELNSTVTTGEAAAVAIERPKIAEFLEPPSATEVESASDIFASNGTAETQMQTQTQAPGEPQLVTPPVAVAPPETQMQPVPAPLPPVRDGEIRISPDHPMAALYMQTPMPPEIKGNRGAGVLIALLATVVFALVYAGVLALWQAPNHPPSTYLQEGFLPWVLNWGFYAAVFAFFVGLAVLVLIVGKAGWWAYVIFGLVAAIFVWAITVLGYALSAQLAGEQVSWHPASLLIDFGLLLPVIAAGIVAREVIVWFGAWIGARGRRIKRENAEAIDAHEKTVAEVQAKLP